MYDDMRFIFEEFHRNFRLIDAVDILFMSVFFYLTLKWFLQAASRGVLTGVSILAAVYFMARALDMYLTSLVFHTAIAAILIILVVTFQEDLRRMFEHVANWGAFPHVRNTVGAVALEIDTLVEAAFSMAASRTGALIAIQGNDPLDRHLDGGQILHGYISEALLYSIFDPSTPGHDGAVIIERNLLEKFAVRLPLSKHEDEIRGRGTRHSAALGLSEVSDALIIVVSEESGAVGVALDGRLKEISSRDELKQALGDFSEAKFPNVSPATWQLYLTEQWRLKLVSLVITSAAWFIFAYHPSTVQRTYIVPVEYRNIPETLMLETGAPTEARVTLSGSERRFRFLEPGNLAISINLMKVGAGQHELTIGEKDMRLPSNLQLYRIEPGLLRLQLREMK